MKKTELRVVEEALSLGKTNLAVARSKHDVTAAKLKAAERKLAAATQAAKPETSPASIDRNPKDVIAHWRFEGEQDFLKDSSGIGHTLRPVVGKDPPAKPATLATGGSVRRLALKGAPGNRHAADFQQPSDFSYLSAKAGEHSFFASEFSFECLLHCDVSQRNFNRTIVDYPGSWTLLHRGLDDRQFELRVRYVSESGQVRDVCTSRQANPEIPPVATESKPLSLQTGRDYYVCLVMATETVSLSIADLTAKTPLQFFEFARSPKSADGKTATDFSKLFRPDAKTPLNLGNSDGTGRFDGLLDEVRYSRIPLTIEQIAATVGQPANDAVRVAAVEASKLQTEHEENGKAVSAAEAEIKAAEIKGSSIAARIRAEKARFENESTEEEIAELTKAAALAENEASLAAARSRLATAELLLIREQRAGQPIAKPQATIKTEKDTIAKLIKRMVQRG